MASVNRFDIYNFANKFANELRLGASSEEIIASTKSVNNADVFGQTAERVNLISTVTPVINAGATEYLTITLDSVISTNVNISGKISAGCILNVRHQEEKQFGFALTTAGDVVSVVSGSQLGTSDAQNNGLLIGDPVALDTPNSRKFKIPFTNTTQFNTKASVLLSLSVSGGGVLSIS